MKDLLVHGALAHFDTLPRLGGDLYQVLQHELYSLRPRAALPGDADGFASAGSAAARGSRCRQWCKRAAAGWDDRAYFSRIVSE